MTRLLLLGVLALAGCNEPHLPKDDPGARLTVMTDRATGCQYLVQYQGSLTARISADDKTHMGCKEGAN
jgi:hypothetical protein